MNPMSGIDCTVRIIDSIESPVQIIGQHWSLIAVCQHLTFSNNGHYYNTEPSNDGLPSVLDKLIETFGVLRIIIRLLAKLLDL